jgi:hypothetical protein
LAVYEFFFSERMPEEEQRALVDFIDQVQQEDIVLVESVQRGLRSGFYKQGQLILSRENGIQHFQKLVYSALTEGLCDRRSPFDRTCLEWQDAARDASSPLPDEDPWLSFRRSGRMAVMRCCPRGYP